MVSVSVRPDTLAKSLGGQFQDFRNIDIGRGERIPKNSKTISWYTPQDLRIVREHGGDVYVEWPKHRRQIADTIRKNEFPAALKDLVRYSKRLKHKKASYWYAHFHRLSKILSQIAPFPCLQPFVEVFREPRLSNKSVSDEDGYAFDPATAAWHLSDGLLSAFHSAVKGNQTRLVQLIRLFLFHEYIHSYHSIGKYSALEVGKFANCLEYIDYTADVYALLHQLDLEQAENPDSLEQEAEQVAFLSDQIQLALLSFWAFDISPTKEWQVRRLRRYLNWYWRYAQLRNTQQLAPALILLRRPPNIELAGLNHTARGRRHYVCLDRPDRLTALEIALVSEDHRLLRFGPSADLNISALLKGFTTRDHEEIKQFFEALHAKVEQGTKGSAGASQAEVYFLSRQKAVYGYRCLD